MVDEGRGREEGNDMRRNILYTYMKMSYITVYNDSMSIKTLCIIRMKYLNDFAT